MNGYAALITGSSRGIGKGIALALASEGFAIGVNAPAPDREVDETVAELQLRGAKATLIVGDVADLAAHDRMLDAAEQSLGPLTTLINNAGVSVMRRGDLLEATPESYDRCQAVNTRGCFFLTQAWARRVLSRERPSYLHHCVITVSSSNAKAVSISRGEYCVSKAGASMIAKLFAVRLGAHDIGSYEIQPGLIETPMTAPVKETYLPRISEGLTVAQRMGKPADIGSIALALATGKLSFCTGQALQADGGLVIPRF
jgi:3-oxoacyl-[acyl-carrier protein] reductase